MVKRLKKVILVAFWLVTITFPLLTGFAVVFLSLQHHSSELNLRPWLVAIVILLIVTAVADVRYRKCVTQREEARNV